MSDNDRESSALPAVTVEPAGTAATPVAESEVLAVSPALVEPEMLVEGLHDLQQRIRDFTHLSWQEKRAHARAASLDSEFLESGIHAAAVWRDTKMFIGRGDDELRQEQEQIRR